MLCRENSARLDRTVAIEYLLGHFIASDDMSGEETARPDYSGMTVNERLFAAGLLHEWDAAARSRDRATMISILMRVDLLEKDATWSVDAVLENPSRYGFCAFHLIDDEEH